MQEGWWIVIDSLVLFVSDKPVAAKKQKRGGVQKRVAARVDALLASLPEDDVKEWIAGSLYSTPTAEARSWFAEAADLLSDDGELKEMVMTSSGYDYCMWNRTIQFIGEHRRTKFAELRAAQEAVDDELNDALAAAGDDGNEEIQEE